MKRIILLTGTILITVCLKSQIYYDMQFNEIESQVGASYYRIFDTTQTEIIEKTYFISDTLKEIVHYSKTKSRIKQGKNFQYYKSGKLSYNIDYVNDQLNGYVLGYFENGNKKRIDLYKNDTLIKGNCYTVSGLDTNYYIFQRNATYKGQNLEAFRRFIASKVKYPPEASEYGITGRVIVQFTVNSKGEVTDLKIIKSPHDLLSQSAIKAIKKSHLWEPAIFDGKPIKQKFVVPIDYSLQ